MEKGKYLTFKYSIEMIDEFLKHTKKRKDKELIIKEVEKLLKENKLETA